MSKSPQEKAEKLYLEGGWEFPALAKKFKVSERTIRRWAESGAWKTRRSAETIASQAIAEEVSEQLEKPIPAKSVRVAMKGLTDEEVMDTAIACLHSAAPDAEIKSQEAAYGQLIKIMQVRQQMAHSKRMNQLEEKLKEAELTLKERQVTPPTPRQWAELAIQYGISLTELVGELRKVLG